MEYVLLLGIKETWGPSGVATSIFCGPLAIYSTYGDDKLGRHRSSGQYGVQHLRICTPDNNKIKATNQSTISIPSSSTDCLYISFTFRLKHTFAFDPLGLAQPRCNAFDGQRGTTRSKERRELSSFDEYLFSGHAQRSRIPTPIRFDSLSSYGRSVTSDSADIIIIARTVLQSLRLEQDT